MKKARQREREREWEILMYARNERTFSAENIKIYANDWMERIRGR